MYLISRSDHPSWSILEKLRWDNLKSKVLNSSLKFKVWFRIQSCFLLLQVLNVPGKIFLVFAIKTMTGVFLRIVTEYYLTCVLLKWLPFFGLRLWWHKEFCRFLQASNQEFDPMKYLKLKRTWKFWCPPKSKPEGTHSAFSRHSKRHNRKQKHYRNVSHSAQSHVLSLQGNNPFTKNFRPLIHTPQAENHSDTGPEIA